MAALPEPIQQFLVRHIDCVDQLDLLVLLFNSLQTEWSAATASLVVHCPATVAQAKLDALAAQGLLAVRATSGKVYGYAPASEALHRQTAAMIETYRERPVTVIRFIYEKAADALRAFADAFKLNPKE